MSARSTARAARRLYAVATLLLSIVSALLLAGLVVSVVTIVVSHNHTVQLLGAGAVVGTLLSWLTFTVLCMSAQALAEHVELHADDET